MAIAKITPEEEKQLTAQLHRFVVESAELRSLERELKRFNVFDVLKSKTNELRHSNILAWLMDPKANHGMGELFLRRWLMAVCSNASRNDLMITLNPVEVDTTPFKAVRVNREWNHIDILLDIHLTDDDHWIIAIENKVRSVQGTSQLKEYRTTVENTYSNASKRLFLFLTMYNEVPRDNEFVPTDYGTVDQALGACLDEIRDVMPPGSLSLIEQYRTVLQEQFMEKTPTVELAHRIYWAHRAALDYLFEHMPDVLGEATQLLYERLQKDGQTLRLIALGSKRGEISFIPSAWDIAENKGAGEWPRVWCFMKFVDLEAITVRAMVGNEVPDMTWRDQLRIDAVRNRYEPTQPNVTPAQFFAYYVDSLTSVSKEESDPRALADSLWSLLRSAVRKDRFAGMEAYMTSRLKELPITVHQ